MARISANAKFRASFAILERHFGRRERYRPHPPVEQALVTLLLRHGKERPAERTIQQLGQYFVDWNEVRVSEAEFLDEVLGNSYPAGIGRLIKDALTAIFNHAQAMTLDDVVLLDPKRAESTLRKMHPMPSRVAGELLLACLGAKELPEGAGLLRVAVRLKLTRPAPSDVQMRSLARLIPKAAIPRAFHAFEMLGERVCTPKDFDCRACPLKTRCPTGAEVLARRAIEEEKERTANEAEAKRRRKCDTRERATRARRKASTRKLKETIQARSKTLRISRTRKKRVRRPRRVAPSATRMAQVSSSEVKPGHRPKKPKRKRAAHRRPPGPGASKAPHPG